MQIHGELHGELFRLIDYTGSQGRSTTHPDIFSLKIKSFSTKLLFELLKRIL